MGSEKKKVVKIVPTYFEHETRDLKEISVLNSLGCNVIVVAKGDNAVIIEESCYTLHRLCSRPLMPFVSNLFLNRLFSLYIWVRYVRKLHGELLSCHDLFCLCIGWLSTLGLRKKPFLVYDSHEFEYGRNCKRNFVSKLFIKTLERFLCKKTALNIVVNESIADAVQTLHGLNNRPIVVRNVPLYWNIDVDKCVLRRKKICEAYGIPIDSFIIMYHGVIAAGRGIENAIYAVENVENTCLLILGNGEKSYIALLGKMISSLRLEQKVFFHPAVEYSILWEYIGSVDVELSVILNTCISYYYALPNKIFESIQAMIPLIVSDFPEMERIVKMYDIGVCCKSDDVNSLVEAIRLMNKDKVLYSRFKANMQDAKKELCWENEKEILEGAYRSILMDI